jgi:hypothetical protein
MESWLHWGTKSNCKIQQSLPAAGSIEFSCGSLQVPSPDVDAFVALEPFTPEARPVVNTIPLVSPTGVEAPLENVPYPLVGQDMVAFEMVTPGPTKPVAIVVADEFWLEITIWALD